MSQDSDFFPSLLYFYSCLRYKLVFFPNVSGWGTKEFIINEPPVAGKCEVVPNVGYALDTMFDINCAKDFEDSEGSLTYDVAYRKNVSGDAISFYSGKWLPVKSRQVESYFVQL